LVLKTGAIPAKDKLPAKITLANSNLSPAAAGFLTFFERFFRSFGNPRRARRRHFPAVISTHRQIFFQCLFQNFFLIAAISSNLV
jgi:hypothetical protein